MGGSEHFLMLMLQMRIQTGQRTACFTYIGSAFGSVTEDINQRPVTDGISVISYVRQSRW